MASFVVTLVRHGETVQNSQRQLQGRTDTALSQVGIQQAEDLGKYLSQVKFTKAVASPLQRAFKTAELVLSKSVNSISLETDNRLMERGFGEAEGKFVPDVFEEAKNAGVPFHLYTPPGAETYQEVQLRTEAFFTDLCHLAHETLKNNQQEHVLIVSHGGWIAALMRYLSNSPHTLANFDRENAMRIPRNTSYHQFHIKPVILESEQINFEVEFVALHEIRHTITNETGFRR